MPDVRAPFDTSIYKMPEQPNALAQLGVLANMQNTMQQAEIQRQTLEKLGAEKAGGAAFLDAIDPNTGLVNTNRLGAILKAHPSVAYSAPEMLQRQQMLQGSQTQNEASATDLALKRNIQIRSGIAGLISKPDLTAQDAVNFVQQQVRAGVIPAAQGQKYMEEIGALGNDRQKIKNYAYGHYATLSGLEAAKPTQVGTDAAGAPLVGTMGGQVRQITGGQAQRPAGAENAVTAAPGVAVGLPPGVAEAQTTDAKAGAEQGIALQKAAGGVNIRKGMLANLDDDLDKFTSGPKADWTMVAKSFANRNLLPQSMQFDPQSIASQEAFNKQATQLAQQQFAALGGTGTDNQLSSAFKSNPNEALSKLGNKQVIQLNKGLEDALTAKNNAWREWQAAGNGPHTFGRFEQEFNKSFNPRVYQAMYMSPEQIADMRKNMSPAEQQQFLKDYRMLKEKGYIRPGGGVDGR